MFCKYCGKEIAEDSVFCSYCGKNLQTDSANVASPTHTPSKADRKTKDLAVLLLFFVVSLLGLIYCCVLLIGGRQYDFLGTNGSTEETYIGAFIFGAFFLFDIVGLLGFKLRK